MVFNILQFKSEQAELEYWKNLAQSRGEELKEATEENEHMQEVLSRAHVLHSSTANDLSHLKRKYESLDESINKLKVRIDDFETKINKIEEKRERENCEMKKRITKLERETSKLNKKVKLQEKKIWKP